MSIPTSKPRNVKKRIAGLMAATALVSAVGSFALFTDRAQSHAEMTAGTLDITLAQNWATDNADVLGTYAPGDILNLDYTLTNNGNLAADVRETFVITSDKVITNEFDIYAADDVEQDAAGTWKPKAGANPIEVRATEANGTGTKITYSIPELTVDGTGEGAETGKATAGTANGSTVADNVKTGDYVLLFADGSSNTVQGANLTVEYLAQALQDRNTGADTWTDAKVISENITIGGTETAVVPENN